MLADDELYMERVARCGTKGEMMRAKGKFRRFSFSFSIREIVSYVVNHTGHQLMVDSSRWRPEPPFLLLAACTIPVIGKNSRNHDVRTHGNSKAELTSWRMNR